MCMGERKALKVLRKNLDSRFGRRLIRPLADSRSGNDESGPSRDSGFSGRHTKSRLAVPIPIRRDFGWED